ncbi:MAG: type I DNA topoisomerase [Candidatus Aminicenantes bacterium]|nr:type I DNA topoisomerase [Candidatus Aminicenantes bacterium]
MKNKILIIVESPAKSNTISKYLDSGYIVSSSMGHIRDLNPKILSIDVENNFKPYYEELKDKKAIINDLKKLSRKSDKIYLAPDPDREGEAIAFHLKEILKSTNKNIFRIYFNEITRNAINKAVENPVAIDMDKVNSQQMRRLLDRLAGYKISPVLQRKIGGRLSAGRVQSIALKLIVEREKEISEFVPEEFWTVTALLEGSRSPQFQSKLEKLKSKKFVIKNESEKDKVLKDLDKSDYLLSKVRKRVKKRRPSPPFITSSLQQEAYRKYGFPVKMTMKVAQELYEGIKIKGGEPTGLITYMRTDSFRISADASKAAGNFIKKKFGKEFLPEKLNVYGTKKKIQDAHEAIRPTTPLYPPDEIKSFLSERQLKIYRIIWDRFIASQMKDAEIRETKFEITNGDYTFLSKGEVIKFKGFMELTDPNDKIIILPDLDEGEKLKLQKLDHKQNFTKPPARYTEASLVKILEDKGIGRPSTYASIIDTLGKRDYVYREEKKFIPSFLGNKVADYLENNFRDLMNYNFTAELEEKLDKVSEGKLDWVESISDYYSKLEKDLGKVNKEEKETLYTGKNCPDCGGKLVRKYSVRTRGWFIGCSEYPKCKYTERIVNGDPSIKKDEILERTCPKDNCGKPLVKRYSPKTKSYFIGCTGYPDCDFIESVKEDLGSCPQCEKPLVRKFQKKSRRTFIACSGYPDCKYIHKIKAST